MSVGSLASVISGGLSELDPEGDVESEMLLLVKASALDLSRSYCITTCLPNAKYTGYLFHVSMPQRLCLLSKHIHVKTHGRSNK